jgi:transcriptional regulator with XRE-family HTH domain
MILIVRGHINTGAFKMARNGKWKTFESGLARLSVGNDKQARGVPRGFCRYVQLDRTYIGGIERGERNVALVNIEKIAKTLRLSIAQLFRGV